MSSTPPRRGCPVQWPKLETPKDWAKAIGELVAVVFAVAFGIMVAWSWFDQIAEWMP